MKKISLFLFLLFYSIIGYSQEIWITGTVVEINTRQPFPYVLIYIDSTLNTLSTFNGTFNLKTSIIGQSDTLKIRYGSYFDLNIINLPVDSDTIIFEEIPLFEYFAGFSTVDYFCGRLNFRCKRAWRKHIEEENKRIDKYYMDKNAQISVYDFRFNDNIYSINLTNHCIDLKSSK